MIKKQKKEEFSTLVGALRPTVGSSGLVDVLDGLGVELGVRLVDDRVAQGVESAVHGLIGRSSDQVSAIAKGVDGRATLGAQEDDGSRVVVLGNHGSVRLHIVQRSTRVGLKLLGLVHQKSWRSLVETLVQLGLRSLLKQVVVLPLLVATRIVLRGGRSLVVGRTTIGCRSRIVPCMIGRMMVMNTSPRSIGMTHLSPSLVGRRHGVRGRIGEPLGSTHRPQGIQGFRVAEQEKHTVGCY